MILLNNLVISCNKGTTCNKIFSLFALNTHWNTGDLHHRVNFLKCLTLTEGGQ